MKTRTLLIIALILAGISIAEAGRRPRHLNPRAAGASLVLDARYIAGADGDSIGTWSDRSGNGYDATQATANSKPLLKLGANGINGFPALLFDGYDDNLVHTFSGSGSFSIFAVARPETLTGGYRGLCANDSTMMLMRSNPGTNKWGAYGSGILEANSSPTAGSNNVFAMMDNAASGGSFFINGSADGTWTGDTIGQSPMHIGGLVGAGQATNMSVGAVVMINAAIAGPLRNRLTQALALIWKIPCN